MYMNEERWNRPENLQPYYNYMANNQQQPVQSPYILYPINSNMGITPWEYEDESAQDIEYLKELYPGNMKQIQSFVEEVCEENDYKGSPMYDEYPDRLALYMMCRQVVEKLEQNDSIIQAGAEEESDMEDLYDDVIESYERKRRGRKPCRGNCLLEDVVQVLLFNELHRRRCRNRRCNWYW